MARPGISIESLHARQRQAVLDAARTPRSWSGRGIVTSAYDRDFASAWVLLSELARLGVRTPIEVFSMPGELSERHAALLAPLNLDLRLRPLQAQHSVRYFLKPHAIWQSGFREVLWLDTDNFPIRDPSFLFDDEEFQQKGSLFWRDVTGAERAQLWHPASPIWPLFNVPGNDAEEFETGQLLVDKEKRLAELALTLHFASDAIYSDQLWTGDKDMFRLAWQNLAAARKKAPPGNAYLRDRDRVPYGFMPFGPFHMGRANDLGRWGGGTVMVQRDREGRALFNHRNLDKFTLSGPNPHNSDIENEAIYHDHLARLKQRLADAG